MDKSVATVTRMDLDSALSALAGLFFPFKFTETAASAMCPRASVLWEGRCQCLRDPGCPDRATQDHPAREGAAVPLLASAAVPLFYQAGGYQEHGTGRPGPGSRTRSL